MSKLALNCLIHGRGLDDVFIIEIDASLGNAVNLLKLRIKEDQELQGPANSLTLFQVTSESISIDANICEKVLALDLQTCAKLSPARSVSSSLPSPSEDILHIL